MKTFYGNYLGVVITGGEKDPEGRGRTQVFVPNIMPTLYENWNEDGQDITFEVIGQGLEGSLSTPVLDRLRQILPWAECAAPIIGSSPSYKPSLIDKASEALRNVGRIVTDVAKDLIGMNQVPQGDAATNLALSNVIANDKTTALSCGKTAREVTMTKLFGYTDAEVRAASNGQRQDGKNWDGVLENLGWQKVAVSSPSEAPANSMLVYKSDTDKGKSPRNGGGGTYGHIEYKGVDSGGNPSYYYGRGMKPNPGGSVPDNFTGYAYIPPPDRQAKALQNAGLPTVSPSALSHPSPVTGMTPDPTQEGALNVDYNQQISSAQDFSSLESSAATGATQSFASIDGSSNTSLSVGSNGKVDPNNMKAYMEQRISSSSLNGYVPADGAKYGIDGSPKSWANYFTKLSEKEGGFEPTRTYKESFNNSKGERVLSSGLFQVSVESVRGYGVGKGLSDAQLQEKLFDPSYNIDAAVAIHEKQVLRHGKIEMGDGKGAGGYFASASMKKIKADVAAGKVDSFDASASPSGAIDTSTQPSTHTSTPHQGLSGPNTNNQALGMFGYASEGQAVWVFFREGDPLFPVYFAASYGQKEWSNMYQYNSPLGVGAGEGGALPGTEAMALNTYGGGLRSAISTDESPLGSNFSFQLYDKNGSNLSFLTDHTEFNSMYNHVSRVLGDHHDINEANKEVRVRGDSNNYVEQDFIVTVGNWSAEAISASDEIQQYINEAMKIKSATGESSNSGGSASKSSSTSQQTNNKATTTQSPYKPTDQEKQEYSKALNNKKNNLDAAAEWKNSTDPALKGVYDSAKRGYDAQAAINKSKNIN